MGQGFKETARLNGDNEKFENNMDRIKILSEALKEKIFFGGEELTLKDFAEYYPEKFESAFQNQMNVELAEKMALVYNHIITEGN